jgi:molecular chaperone GrpE
MISDEKNDVTEIEIEENKEGAETQESAQTGEPEFGSGETEPEINVEELKEELKKTRKENKEYHDRLLRLSAEFENYKKRTAREMDNFRKYANDSLVRDLLPLKDNLERALELSETAEAGSEGITEGIRMMVTDMMKVLNKYGVQPVEALGKPFNPEYHEAVMQEETEEAPENTVVKEFEKGYILHDRLVRPSKVVVAKPVKQ